MPTIEATQVEKVVYDALESFGAEPTELAPDATFEQLDVDSLDLAELAQIAEDKFGVKIDSGDAEQLKTVGDVVELIVARS
jgi:acyl carrier protein